MTPEHDDEHQRLGQLEGQVDHGEQKERADRRWGKSYLQYGGAQLDVLTARFHSNCPPLPSGGTDLFISDRYIKKSSFLFLDMTYTNCHNNRHEPNNTLSSHYSYN